MWDRMMNGPRERNHSEISGICPTLPSKRFAIHTTVLVAQAD
jgi:hypothetical protein